MKYLLLFLLVACNEKYAPPLIERCATGLDSWQCHDIRKPKKEQSYDKTPQENFICTNPDDYDRLYDYVKTIRELLIKCERAK